MKTLWGYSSEIDWFDPGDLMRATIRQQVQPLLHRASVNNLSGGQHTHAVGNLLSGKLHLTYNPEPSSHEVCFADSYEVRPEFRTSFRTADLIDYGYAMVFSEVFKHEFNDLLTQNFSIPAPPDVQFFWKMSHVGNQLRLLHTHESANRSSGYRFEKNVLIGKCEYRKKAIYINQKPLINDVTEGVWNFKLGTIYPAQKWLHGYQGQVMGPKEFSDYTHLLEVLKRTEALSRAIDLICAGEVEF